MLKENKNTLIVTLLTIFGGLVGAFITSLYQDEVSKRLINAQVIELLSDKLINQATPLLNDKNDRKQLNKVFQSKENALLIRQVAKHIEMNYDFIDFGHIATALSAIERRHSYARLYEASGQAKTICENIILFWEEKDSQPYEVNGDRSKCESSKLDGIQLKLTQFDLQNYRFEVTILPNEEKVMCNNDEGCAFWVDLGDRLESTSYQYLVLAEFVGYADTFKKLEPIVALSIIKRN